MNFQSTRTGFFAIALTIIAAANPVLAQQARQAAPAKRTATTATTARPSTGRPASTAQRSSVSPGTTTASVAKPSAAPATTTQAPAKPAETAAQASQQPKPGVQTTRTQSAQPRTSGAAARPAKSLGAGRTKYLNAGIGLAAYYGGGLPLGVSFEMDLKNNISVGGSIDYFRYGYNSGGYRWNYTFVYAGARGSYHLGEVLNIGNSKFDPYVGATLGFRYAGYNDNYDGYGYDYVSPYNSGLFLGAHLGSRYMFSEKIGAFAEVGYGVSALRLGVTAKL